MVKIIPNSIHLNIKFPLINNKMLEYLLLKKINFLIKILMVLLFLFYAFIKYLKVKWLYINYILLQILII